MRQTETQDIRCCRRFEMIAAPFEFHAVHQRFIFAALYGEPYKLQLIDFFKLFGGTAQHGKLPRELVAGFGKQLLPAVQEGDVVDQIFHILQGTGGEKHRSALRDEFKQQLMDEINALQVDGMPKVQSLNALVGGYINLEYRLPNGQPVKFLDDGATYLGTQLECEFGGNRCFGIAANMDFILICTYEENGENPELVIYKKR